MNNLNNMISKRSFPGIALIIALLFCSSLVYSQNNAGSGKAKGRTVHEEKTVKGKKSTTIDSEEKYDKNGNVIEEIEYKDGKVDKRMVYEYDANNNKIKETELNSSGKPKKTGEYKYVNGIRTEKNTFDETKKLISRKIYTYNY